MGTTGVMPTPVTPNSTSPACWRSSTKKPIGPVKRIESPGFSAEKNAEARPPSTSFKMRSSSVLPGVEAIE
jgi:hypothetical protein